MNLEKCDNMGNLGKKLYIVIIVVIAMFVTFSSCVFFNTGVAFAENQDEYGGYSLKTGFDVQVIYHYHVRYASGIYFAYEVIFDKNFYKTVEDKKELFNTLKDTFVKNLFLVDIDLDNGRMNAYIEYDSIAAYHVAIGEDGYSTASENKPTKKTLFYLYYTSMSKTVLSGIKTEGRYINRIYQNCIDLGVPEERILLSYVYGTPYGDKTITSTADSITYDTTEKIYRHEFDMTVKDADKSITIYQKVPNSAGWYMMAILVGLVVLSVPIATLILNQKRRK